MASDTIEIARFFFLKKLLELIDEGIGINQALKRKEQFAEEGRGLAD